MANSITSVVICLTFIFLLACTCTSVYGTETLPSGVERIHAQCAWDNNRDMVVDNKGVNGSGIIIAVIDTGIDYTNVTGEVIYHLDLAENVAGGTGFWHHWQTCEVFEETEYTDYYYPYGHGTHVAGIIAAVDNDIGVIGTAPKTKVYAIRYRAATGQVEGEARAVAAAINWAVAQGAHMISMSFGFRVNYSFLYTACRNAYDVGKLLIAAAGNENSSISYPAKYDFVIAVGAVDKNDKRWNPSAEVGSNFGPELDFVAPGMDINSTVLNGGYGLKNGTSVACPHVAAVAALIWSSKIDQEYDFYRDNDLWDRDEVLAKLHHLALDLGPPGKDNEYGYGLINAWATNQRPLGDINIDHITNILDAILLAGAWGSKPGDQNWAPRADINIDNVVNILDSIIIANNFGKKDP